MRGDLTKVWDVEGGYESAGNWWFAIKWAFLQIERRSFFEICESLFDRYALRGRTSLKIERAITTRRIGPDNRSELHRGKDRTDLNCHQTACVHECTECGV